MGIVRKLWAVPLLALALATAGCGGSAGSSTAGTSPTPMPTPTPAPTPAPAPPYPTGLSDARISVSGVERQFSVYIPAGLTQARAVIVVLHGGSGSPAQAASFAISPQAVFRTVADRESAVIVYPAGLDNNWNDCRSDAPGIGGAGDDIAFFDALLTRLQTELGVDARRIFLTGTSNGAMMSMRYAFERSDRVAAIAISSGNLAGVPKTGRCASGPTRAVPILLTHGTLDDMVPYGGGCVAALLVPQCQQGTVTSAIATRDRWLGYNGLASVTATMTSTNLVLDDGGPAVRHVYAGTTPLEWWRLDGAGHNPPSRTVFLDRVLGGAQNRDVEFAEIAWTFFAARLP